MLITAGAGGMLSKFDGVLQRQMHLHVDDALDVGREDALEDAAGVGAAALPVPPQKEAGVLRRLLHLVNGGGSGVPGHRLSALTQPMLTCMSHRRVEPVTRCSFSWR